MAQRRMDPDRDDFAGCMLFSSVALLVALIPIVWVSYAMYTGKAHYTISGLSRLVLISASPSVVISLLAARRLGVPGVMGSFGGFLCTGVFWFLIMRQVIAKAPAEFGGPPEYIDATVGIVPIVWVMVGAICSFGLPRLFPRRKSENK